MYATDQTQYAESSGEDYIPVYGPVLTSNRTERDAGQIAELLELPPRIAILDLCRGHGRHAIALATRGYQVTGQDLSARFLERAAANAAGPGNRHSQRRTRRA